MYIYIYIYICIYTYIYIYIIIIVGHCLLSLLSLFPTYHLCWLVIFPIIFDYFRLILFPHQFFLPLPPVPRSGVPASNAEAALGEAVVATAEPLAATTLAEAEETLQLAEPVRGHMCHLENHENLMGQNL